MDHKLRRDAEDTVASSPAAADPSTAEQARA